MRQEMKYITKLAFGVLAALSIAACDVRRTDNNTRKQSTVTVQSQMDSEQLASAAEQLIGPYTFMVAREVALQSLEKDPTNIKAQFIVSMLQRFEAFRGLYPRIRTQLELNRRAELDKWIATFPESPLKRFLVDPARKSLQSSGVGGVQEILGEYYAGIAEFRDFLKKNQSKNIA